MTTKTKKALASIARVTLENVTAFERGEPIRNEVRAEHVLQPPKPVAHGSTVREVEATERLE